MVALLVGWLDGSASGWKIVGRLDGGAAGGWKRVGSWMVALLVVRREWDGWMVALLVGREWDGWMLVALLVVGRE